MTILRRTGLALVAAFFALSAVFCARAAEAVLEELWQ